MIRYLLLIAAFCLGVTSAFAGQAEDLRKVLISEGQRDYFPEYADYKLFENICGPAACFHAMSVSYVSSSNKGMIRLALFSEDGHYLGCYSGLPSIPVNISSSVLKFETSKDGDHVDFSEKSPPDKIWLDGYAISFDPAL